MQDEPPAAADHVNVVEERHIDNITPEADRQHSAVVPNCLHTSADLS